MASFWRIGASLGLVFCTWRLREWFLERVVESERKKGKGGGEG